MLLEVATTTELAPSVPERIATEYLRSKAFCEFVTSALHQHTDLPINMDAVEITGEVVDDRCVVIKTLYRHRDEDARVTLPDRTVITLKQGDTVRLYISRKYAPEALHAELAELGLAVRATADTTWAVRRQSYRFGLQLLLLGQDSGVGTEPAATASPARDLFRS